MKIGSHRIAALSHSDDGLVNVTGVIVEKIRENFPAVVFWCSAIFLLFWSLGVKGLWGPEDRWAEVVREMRLTGDYFHPTINGVPYFDKPLLGYWLIALSAAVAGRLDEWVVRLPSAIAGLLAGLSIGLLPYNETFQHGVEKQRQVSKCRTNRFLSQVPYKDAVLYGHA